MKFTTLDIVFNLEKEDKDLVAMVEVGRGGGAEEVETTGNGGQE